MARSLLWWCLSLPSNVRQGVQESLGSLQNPYYFFLCATCIEELARCLTGQAAYAAEVVAMDL